MAVKTYTVKWGDTLYDIAIENGTTYQTLAKINGLPITKRNGQDFVLLTVGQVIKLENSNSSTSTPAKVLSGQVKINTFGLQSTTDRGMYVTWSWDRDNTKEYQVEWSEYYDGYWHYTTNTTTYKYNEYTAKTQATSVRVRIKPVAKTYKNTKGKEVAHFTNVSWTGRRTYSFSSNPPKVPGVPKVDIVDDKLTAYFEEDLSNLNASIIEFNLRKDGQVLSNSKSVKINPNENRKASAEITIDLGSKYEVRARAKKSEKVSAWGVWSPIYSTKPSKPTIQKCMAGADDRSIELSWEKVPSADTYLIEYAPSTDENGKKYDYFSNPTDSIPYKYENLSEEQIKNCYVILTENVEGTKEYRVRIRAKNTEGESDWSIESVTSMKDGPLSPTTFTDYSVYSVGDVVTLKWTHNHKYDKTNTSNNNSSTSINYYAKYSHIDLYINDGSGSGFVRKSIATQKHVKEDGTSIDDSTEGKYSYSIYIASEVDEANASDYDIVCPNGCTIRWRIRTAEENGVFGEWSAMRTVHVFAKPTLELEDSSGNILGANANLVLETFPLKVLARTGPEEIQVPLSYHIEVKANKAHEKVDNYGETVWVDAGDVVYAQSFDDIRKNDFTIELSASDITLVNDETYTVTCTVAMNSGLTVESSFTTIVRMTSEYYVLDAEVVVDEDSYTVMIRPYCENASGELVENVWLSVYRREYDGSFTRISSNLDNLAETFVTDPHPALDYARYRIVAVNDDTGQMNYADLPGYPVNCKSIILQWNETWHNFDEYGDYDENLNSWTGSLLKLPYNIDIQNRYAPDVSLVEYIGRANPVSYYGTQHGESATWTVEIAKTDIETIYALRRLAKWMGDVYVREPSGTGYWANVSVSFNIKHKSLTIPVTLGITKVEGGM